MSPPRKPYALAIEQYDVVSQQVVEQMVVGACRLFQTDYAHSVCLHLSGSREENTQTAVDAVLEEFLNYLLKD